VGSREAGENPPLFVVSSKGDVTPKAAEGDVEAQERRRRTREKLRQQLKEGKLEEREVEIEVQQQGFPGLEMMQPPQGMEGTDVNFTELLQEMLPKKKKRRTVHLHEARRILVDEELKKLVDMDDVVNETLEFTHDGIKEIARIAAKANERMENIGARRLHTVMTTLLEDVLFDLPELAEKRINFDADKVRARLGKIVDDEDLRRYIL